MNSSNVSSIVRKLITSRPFVKECLVEGVVNYSALARLLTRELESMEVRASHSAVKVALTRIRRDLLKSEESLRSKLKHILSSSVLQLQTDLKVVTVRKHSILLKLPDVAKVMETSRFSQLLQGVNTFTVIISRENFNELLKHLSMNDVVEVLEDQAAVILISPREIVETPGVVAFVTSTLYENNINITQIVSCYSDTIILVDSSKISDAFRVLESLIKSMRTS